MASGRVPITERTFIGTKLSISKLKVVIPDKISNMDGIWDELIKLALREDYDGFDVTSEALFSPDHRCSAVIVAKEQGIISGLELSLRAFRLLDQEITVSGLMQDGSRIEPGNVVARLMGNTRSLLAGERVALNLLMRLSGIATATNVLQSKLNETGLGIRIADTRKTTPLWRFAEKKAVRDGGGLNHRFNLSDAVLIKDNHIKLAGGAAEAVRSVLARCRHIDVIEVEVSDLAEISPLLNLGVNAILLDNMPPEDVRKAVKLIAGRAMIEVSGGITPENIQDYAIPGVNILSVGWITHSAPALNFSLEVGGGSVD